MKNDNSIILIAAGGTGGHIMPGLAIAKGLTAKNYKIHWLGTKAGLEAKLVPAANIPLSYISISGLRGKHWLTLLIMPIKIIVALIQALLVLRKVKPLLVIGMGGFVAGPCGIAAWLLGIPLIIHEQNAIAGTTNRILAKFAKKILTGFPNSFPQSKQVSFTGNPLREEILTVAPPLQRFASSRHKKLRLLILGGSRGALVLNNCICQTLQQLSPDCIEVWHQTGALHFAHTVALYQQLPGQHKVEAFIENIAKAYAWADLVICRAGAITIAELTAVGIASILVPFPLAIDDHQTQNAKYLSNAAAAILLPQTELTPIKLATILQEFIANKEKLLTMAQLAQQLAKINAVNAVIMQAESLLKASNN